MQKPLSERVLRLDEELSDEHQQLIGNLVRRRQLVQTGEWDPVQDENVIVYIFTSGGMRGIYGAGVAIGLEDRKLAKGANHLIGLSAGAACAYLVAGQAKIGATIYEDLANSEFVKYSPLELDIGLMGEMFTIGPKALDLQAVADSQTGLHIALTNMQNAQPEYLKIDQNNINNLVGYIMASSSIPGLAPAVRIDGKLYGDGVMTCRNPIGYAINELGATDILIVQNQPLREKSGSVAKKLAKLIGSRAAAKILTRKYIPEIYPAMLERHNNSDEQKDTEYPGPEDGVRIAVICPDEVYPRFTRNPELIRKIAQKGLQAAEVFPPV